MPFTIVCPTCQQKSSVPDDRPGGRAKCRGCGTIFPFGTAVPKPAANKPPAARGAFDDLEDEDDGEEAAMPAAATGMRRGAAAQSQGSGPSAGVIAAIAGVGGVVVLLLVVLVVMMSRGGSEPKRDVVAAPPTPVSAEEKVVEAPAPAPVPVADGQAVVQKLKGATVYIKNMVNGRQVASGTGFVIEVTGGDVLLATNRHVAVLELDELPDEIAPQGAKVELQAVFRSGQGSDVEQTLHADIIAADLSGDVQKDLAFLLVKGVRNPPQPLVLNPPLTVVEGMEYVGAGFPLGGIVNGVVKGTDNPSVTITGGRVSALRGGNSQHPEIVQVDGSLQPGNSGGPIVEKTTGRLIGVAVAKVSAVDTIGFVVPGDQVRRALGGTVGDLDLTFVGGQPGSADLQVKAQLVDPKNAVQGVVIHAAPASGAAALAPQPNGTYLPLPNSTPVELARSTQGPDFAGSVRVPLSGQGPEARKVFIQTAHRNAQNQLVYSKPHEITLPEKPGRIRDESAFDRLIKAVRKKTLAKLGKLIDPEGDCKLSKDPNTYQVKIDVPGGKVRTLSPEVTKKKNTPMHNAPRVLMDVKGDFAAVVEVGGVLDAGLTAPKGPTGRRMPIVFQGAGLLLYQDEKNFLRFERCAGTAGTSTAVHRILIEMVHEGKQAIPPYYVNVPDGKIGLILVRRNGKLRCMFSPDKRVILSTRELPNDFKDELQIGVSAASISQKDLKAEFEDLVVVQDTKAIDSEFGE